jgi:hypothetical protein
MHRLYRIQIPVIVKGRYNTSTVTLRVLEGEERGGYNWATLSLVDINTENWPSGLMLDARLTTLQKKKKKKSVA